MCQSSWAIEFGFKGVIPEVFTDTHTIQNNGKIVTVNQRALPQRDYAPFPYIAQGLVINILENYDKFSLGLGYSFHYDYHTFSNVNASAENSFTAKLQNHLIYLLARVNLKHDYKHSVFVGIKLGLMLALEGYGDDLGLLNSLAEGENRQFDAYPLNSTSPGLYAAIQLGVKFYFYTGVKAKAFPGLKVIFELEGATPTISTGRQILNESKDAVVGINNEIKYRWDYSNLGIRLLFFVEIPKKKPFVFDFTKKKKRSIPYQQY